MIIDAHAHLGYDESFDEDFTEDELVRSRDECGRDDCVIDITLVQPGTVHDLDGVKRAHDAIAALCTRHEGRFRGIANPSPHLAPSDYERELRRTVEELAFVGVKIHPLAHAVNPCGRAGTRVFALASEMGLPVMVHTGVGLPWSAPALLARPAAQHPKLTIIAAHAGGGMCALEAEQLARQHPNVTLEVSWLPGFIISRWARSLGSSRLMFGSDHADNLTAELAKIRATGIPPEDLEQILGGSASRAFGLGRTAR